MKVIHEDGSPFPAIPVPCCYCYPQSCTRCNYGVYRPLSKDNVWLLVDAIPQKIVNNTVEQVVCTFIDITGRKEAELALKKKEMK
jgi:PAS domain-containing protein